MVMIPKDQSDNCTVQIDHINLITILNSLQIIRCKRSSSDCTLLGHVHKTDFFYFKTTIHKLLWIFLTRNQPYYMETKSTYVPKCSADFKSTIRRMLLEILGRNCWAEFMQISVSKSTCTSVMRMGPYQINLIS